MFRNTRSSFFVSAVMGFVLALSGAAHAGTLGLELSAADWQTVGPDVRFHFQFHNPDPTLPSEIASGQAFSQPFGAFLPDFGPIGSFNIPPIPPDSFFDVFFDIALADLPPSAEKIIPGGGTAFGPNVPEPSPCPPDNFWAGNVDIFWTGPGGSGQANVHNGTIQICPGATPSYIHVISDCQDPLGMSWSFSGVCANWTATLVVNNGGLPGGPAPNPIPAGFFDGWICVSANLPVTVGDICSFDLNLMCGNQPATVHLTAEACDWIATPVEPSTWGSIKALYRD